jgi:hypothetical protein
MTPHNDRLSRRGFVTAMGAAGLGAVTLGGSVAWAGGRVARPATRPRQATPVSYVDTSLEAYDKLTLMVDDQPFYHSGVQFRYEKHKITYGWTDEQLAPVFPMISEDGFTIVNMSIWWSQVEPEKDVFDFTEIERYVELCSEHGLKLELLWMGTDSGGSSVGQGLRLPEYVTTDYQWVVDENGDRVTHDGWDLLDKTDPHLLEREALVLGRLMAHVASYDTGHTLIGVQCLNEPNVSNVRGVALDRSYSDYSNALWEEGGYTDAARFRNDVLLAYVSELGRAVKESNHPVWTRCNVIGDAKPIAENEARRERGETIHLDFFGDDPYTTDIERLYTYGFDEFWAMGRNFPMAMETYAGDDTSEVLKFNGIAGNAAHNMYAALDPDSETGSNSQHGLYDYDIATKEITRRDISSRVAALNHLLNKISRDLATKKPVEAGGLLLQTFNRAASADFESTKDLDGSTLTYATSTGGQSIAAKRGQAEYALVSTQDGTFTIPGTLSADATVQVGSFDQDDTWVSQGQKPYEETEDGIAIDLTAGECVRVSGLS